MQLLESRRNDPYEAALAELREDTRERWAGMLTRDADELDEGEKSGTPDESGLRRFLESEVMPWFENRQKGTDQTPAHP